VFDIRVLHQLDLHLEQRKVVPSALTSPQ